MSYSSGSDSPPPAAVEELPNGQQISTFNDVHRSPFSSLSFNNRNEMPDLDGGTLLDVQETEEIDPEDGCKVFIQSFHILSADGTEESTITKRRKLKVNCTQSLRRVEYQNGKESKFEEKTTVLDCLDAFGVMDPATMELAAATPMEGFETIQDSVQQQSIGDVLLKTQDTFLTLLREKKDRLVEMFPELFSNLRSQPAIFDLLPSTQTETVVNEDGSTVTRTKSSKAFSTKFTRHEMYINGIRQETRQCFRAFMEFGELIFLSLKHSFRYAGPDGGFRIRLSDNADADLSEEEDSDESGGGNNNRSSSVGPTRAITWDKRLSIDGAFANLTNGSRRIDSVSRSGLSEIPDTVSAFVAHDEGGMRSKPKMVVFGSVEPVLRQEKAWHAVTEMVESETRYVQKLALLERFHEDVERARLLDKKQMSLLFANITSLYAFHNDHLFVNSIKQSIWISDVLRKQAPFLKMYSEYTNNYKKATTVFEECRKKRAFEDIVRRLERLPECDGLSLISHFICPVQRVMRYQLLLKEYLKYLTESDPDFDDTEAALNLVIEAATHANEMMRKLDRYRNVLEVQELLGNSISLVSPSRELLKKAKLGKISSSTERVEERVLFVFNDLFLLASERSTLISGIGGSSRFKLRAIFDAYFTSICQGNNLEREHSFYLRGSDCASGPLRCVELFCSSQAEKNEIFETVWNAIEDCHEKQRSSSSSSADTSSPPSCGQTGSGEQNCRGFLAEKCCAQCETEFKWRHKPHFCSRCQQRLCKKCFGSSAPKSNGSGKGSAGRGRVCRECHRTQDGIRSRSEGISATDVASGTADVSMKLKRFNNLATPATNTDDVIQAGFVDFHGPSGKWLHRYFVLRKDFCLYSYMTPKDFCALSMLPLSGCDIDHQSSSSERFSFTIKHVSRIYTIHCTNESEHAEWMAAMLLSANAKLPGEMQPSSAANTKTAEKKPSLSSRIRPSSPLANNLVTKRSASIGTENHIFDFGMVSGKCSELSKTFNDLVLSHGLNNGHSYR